MPERTTSELETLLIEIAGLALAGQDGLDRLREISTRLKLDNPDGLLDLLLRHGLGALAYHLLKPVSVDLDPGPKLALQGIFLRQRDLSAAQTKALTEIVREAGQGGLELVLLKGAALGHLVYAQPVLRPKSDLDLWVRPDQLAEASGLLAGLGFRPRLDPADVAGTKKHLPQTKLQIDGQEVVVELHHSIMPPGSMGIAAVNQSGCTTLDFELDRDGLSASTLSPDQMLRHLCHHLCEHAIFRVRLIWMLDIVLWAERYADRIDWEGLAQRDPLTLNTLSLLHGLWPLSAKLQERLGIKESYAMHPDLRHWPIPWRAAMGELGMGRFMAKLFFPSLWWLKLYYGLGPAGPAWLHRCLIHPWHILTEAIRRPQP